MDSPHYFGFSRKIAKCSFWADNGQTAGILRENDSANIA
jgi:hypothetical protein